MKPFLVRKFAFTFLWHTAQKMKFSITEEIPNKNLHFFCSYSGLIDRIIGRVVILKVP